VAREIDMKSLVRSIAGPERPVKVYDTRYPKYERPGHNPFEGLLPDILLQTGDNILMQTGDEMSRQQDG
jgi:hypothetical protein